MVSCGPKSEIPIYFVSQLFLFVAQSNNRASTGFIPVEFSIQLSAYYPDKAYGGDRVFADMLEQVRQADRPGCDAVSIADELSNAKLVILDRLKHAILIDGPEAVLSQLKPFLLQQI
jgi:hypothetical protein